MYTVYNHIAPNGKIYIGITSQKPEERWKKGWGYINNKHFYSAIMQYGWDNIQHIIMETGLTKEQAEKEEIRLIKEHRSFDREYGYNNCTGGNCGCSGYRHTEEAKQRIREGNKGKFVSEETRQKIGAAHKGMSHTEETKARIRALKTGMKHTEEAKKKISEKNKGHFVSGETRKKIGLANKGKKVDEAQKLSIRNAQRIEILCVETGKVYEAIADATKETGIYNIDRVCSAKIKTAGGYHWQYLIKKVEV